MKNLFKNIYIKFKIHSSQFQSIYLLCISCYIYFAFGISWRVFFLYILIGFYGIIFDKVTGNIGDGSKSLIWIGFGIFFILFFKNSTEKSKEFAINNKSLFLTLIYFLSSILSLNQVSEFLYFNF